MTGSTQNIDLAAVERFMTENVPGYKGPLSAQKFDFGQSNPTFRLDAASGSYVLRRKPPGELLKSAHAVDREFRVQKALADTNVPVATMYALCEDESVIGTMFYIMSFVEGRHFILPTLKDLDKEERAAIYDSMNSALAALHDVDVEAVGLSDYGRPGNYYERQINRWTKQYRAAETETVEDMDNLIDWLNANMPEDDGRVGLVHGDYRIDNMMFHKERPDVIAVLDWELSTLGHPFADLAYQCMQWRMPANEEGRGLEGLDRKALGIPTEEEYVAKYCERRNLTGIPQFNFYLAFSFFRMTSIVQGVYKRGLDGNASNPERALRAGRSVKAFAEKGMAAALNG